MGWWLSVPRFGVSWFFRLHVEASAHGSSGPPVLPVGSLVLWSSWLIGCGHRIIRSIAAKKRRKKSTWGILSVAVQVAVGSTLVPEKLFAAGSARLVHTFALPSLDELVGGHREAPMVSRLV